MTPHTMPVRSMTVARTRRKNEPRAWQKREKKECTLRRKRSKKDGGSFVVIASYGAGSGDEGSEFASGAGSVGLNGFSPPDGDCNSGTFSIAAAACSMVCGMDPPKAMESGKCRCRPTRCPEDK